MSDEPKKWSELSPQELLDMAQVSESHQETEHFLAAAQVQATLHLMWTMWTIENRLGPTIGSAIWEGMRQ